MITSAIDCLPAEASYENPQPGIDQYKQVCQIVDAFKNDCLRPDVLHVVPPSMANFYGGTKVSFTLDYKHSYYPWINTNIIEALEDLMNLLPFHKAVLYAENASCVVEWHLVDDIEKNLLNTISESSKYAHIRRVAYGRIDELPPCRPTDKDKLFIA